MVSVPRKTFAFNISSPLTEVKYLSKYRCVPLGRDYAIWAIAFPSDFPAAPDHWDWRSQMLSVLWDLLSLAQTAVQDAGLWRESSAHLHRPSLVSADWGSLVALCLRGVSPSRGHLSLSLIVYLPCWHKMWRLRCPPFWKESPPGLLAKPPQLWLQ